MFVITYGVNVPAGLFLPGMIIGCALGQIYVKALTHFEFIDKEITDDLRKNMIVISTAAALAGYTRMTYSLAVIIMETS